MKQQLEEAAAGMNDCHVLVTVTFSASCSKSRSWKH